eukprot:g6455.t1
MEISDAAKSGDGTTQNVGIKVNATFQCAECRQKFDSEKAGRPQFCSDSMDVAAELGVERSGEWNLWAPWLSETGGSRLGSWS